MPSPAAQSRIAVPSAPDCDMNAMVPGGGIVPAKIAFSFDGVAIRPRQFGPRMPHAGALGGLDELALERARPPGRSP